MKLVRDKTDIVENFRVISEAKREPRKGYLKNVKIRVTDSQTLFISKSTSDELVALRAISCSDEEKEALIHCYESRTDAFSGVLSKIKERQPLYFREHCSYCHLYTPSTWDHYLPKESYPEFSVLSDNLVPACSYCNTKKGTSYVADGTSTYLNPYFDEYNSTEFLECELAIQDNSIVYHFSLRESGLVNHPQGHVIRKQFGLLELLQVYADRANSFISEHVLTLSSYFEGDIAQLNDDILHEYELFRRRFGQNFWKTAVLKGIVTNAEVLHYVYDQIQLTNIST